MIVRSLYRKFYTESSPGNFFWNNQLRFEKNSVNSWILQFSSFIFIWLFRNNCFVNPSQIIQFDELFLWYFFLLIFFCKFLDPHRITKLKFGTEKGSEMKYRKLINVFCFNRKKYTLSFAVFYHSINLLHIFLKSID